MTGAMRVALFVGLLCWVPQASAAQTCATIYESKFTIQTLSGALHRQLFWGPPNFGEHPETDQHYRGWMLRLDAPLRVLNVPTQFNGNGELRDIQIRVERGSLLYRSIDQLTGKHVITSGNLVVAVLPSDNTAVVQWANEAHASRKRLTGLCVRTRKD